MITNVPPIPLLMAKLKKFQGLPVPFTVFWGDDGVPNFRVVDEERKRQCLEKRLCGMCGQGITGQLALIGGESSIANRLFLDPPMHPICARWAAKVCPYLSNGQARHRLALPNVSGGDVRPCLLVSTSRPKRMGLYLTDGYEYGTIPNSNDEILYVQAHPAVKIDWTLMPETT